MDVDWDGGLPCACLFDEGDKPINRCLYHKERDDEIERLRKIIVEAPHSPECDLNNDFLSIICTCWKLKVDDEGTEDA